MLSWTWMQKIEAEIASLKPEDYEPSKEIDEMTETPVAVVTSHELRALFTLVEQRRQRCIKMAEDLNNTPLTRQPHEIKSQESAINSVFLIREAKVIMELFWLSLENDHPETQKNNYGIRKGWQLVITQNQQNIDQNIGSLLEHLLRAPSRESPAEFIPGIPTKPLSKGDKPINQPPGQYL